MRYFSSFGCRKFLSQHFDSDLCLRRRLHVLKLVHSPLRVALSHLPQGLVLVAALSDVLLVDAVHRRLSGLVPGVRQVLLQRLELVLESLVALGQRQTIVDRVFDVVLEYFKRNIKFLKRGGACPRISTLVLVPDPIKFYNADSIFSAGHFTH